MLSIQLATPSHLDEICAFDQVARQEPERVEFIARAIQAGMCHIAVDGAIRGYAVLEYSFYEQGFIPMLYIHPDWRGQGIGRRLTAHLESVCRTEKLFTSTNLSNLPMQALLAKLEYKLSGVIHDLDEGDPELIYVKYLKKTFKEHV